MRIDSERDQLAALFSPAVGADARTPVLFCGPWGWDEVASYRARREWARRLAAAGFPALRIDLPAVGDSTGTPREEGIVARWVEAVAAAAAWLDGAAGGAGVAVLGLGLGGLLALEAAAPGSAIVALALWATPASGERFVREARAFSRMESWNAGDGDTGGWLEAGGFCLSPATLAELAELAPEAGRSASLRRVLALERDGVAADAKLLAALEAAGVEIEQAPGPGWGEMASHPERTVLPEAVADELEGWLEGALAPAVVPAARKGAPEPEPAALELGAWREEPVSIEQPWGGAYGVLATPAEDRADGLCAVFLNAGAVRHVGPDRLWVEAARRWAGRGVPSLRVDLEGIGEADGDYTGRNAIGDFYTPEFDDGVRAVLDALRARDAGERFLLIGLCAGGYWSFRAAISDSRVAGAVLLNAGALRWTEGILDERQAGKLERVGQAGWWLKILRGEISPARLRYFARLAFGKQAARLRRALAREPAPVPGAELIADLDRVAGTRVLLAFSDGEPLHKELEVKGILAGLDRWPDVELVALPGDDHTLRPPAAQAAAHRLLDAELEKASARRRAGPA